MATKQTWTTLTDSQKLRVVDKWRETSYKRDQAYYHHDEIVWYRLQAVYTRLEQYILSQAVYKWRTSHSLKCIQEIKTFESFTNPIREEYCGICDVEGHSASIQHYSEE